MENRDHVENDQQEDLFYPHKVRLFARENEHYCMAVQPGAMTMTLDDWLALEYKEGYHLSEISTIDEYHAIVILDRENNSTAWRDFIDESDKKNKSSNNGNGSKK